MFKHGDQMLSALAVGDCAHAASVATARLGASGLVAMTLPLRVQRSLIMYADRAAHVCPQYSPLFENIAGSGLH